MEIMCASTPTARREKDEFIVDRLLQTARVTAGLLREANREPATLLDVVVDRGVGAVESSIVRCALVGDDVGIEGSCDNH